MGGQISLDGEVGVEIQRILCPSDFSEASAHAIDLAIALAEVSKATIVGLHARAH